MAITADDINNQSFSIDRKGYNVDEVDVFLEHVADEIDALNAQVADLQGQLEQAEQEDAFAGFDTPATAIMEPVADEPVEEVEEVEAVEEPEIIADEALQEALAEKDARIAELEAALEDERADGSAIAQALIIAQRSADELRASAKNEAANIIADAEREADRIVAMAEEQRQRIANSITKMEDDREDSRAAYQEMLQDFIADATQKLAYLGNVASRPRTQYVPLEPMAAAAAEVAPVAATGQLMDLQAAPAYASMAAATVKPMAEKDFSGFGDADDDMFAFDELD